MTAIKIAQNSDWNVYSNFGSSIVEGSLDPQEEGRGTTVEFTIEQKSYALKSAFVVIEPTSGSYSDFWDDFWSNKVGGEPADKFALSNFISFSSSHSKPFVQFTLNFDGISEGEEFFNLAVYESNIDAAFGTPPLIRAKFSIVDDDINGSQSNDKLSGIEVNEFLRGFGGNDTLKGNKGGDHLFGCSGDDQLFGGFGKDYLDGGNGDDYIYGGRSGDKFIFKGKSFGDDVIHDFQTKGKIEKVDLSGVGPIKGFKDLMNNHLSDVNGDAVIEDGLGNSIRLIDVSMDDLSANDFLF